MKCHICGKEREEYKISVITTDISTEWNWKPGTMIQNVYYCIDNKGCREKSVNFRLFKHD